MTRLFPFLPRIFTEGVSSWEFFDVNRNAFERREAALPVSTRPRLLLFGRSGPSDSFLVVDLDDLEVEVDVLIDMNSIGSATTLFGQSPLYDRSLPELDPFFRVSFPPYLVRSFIP